LFAFLVACGSGGGGGAPVTIPPQQVSFHLGTRRADQPSLSAIQITSVLTTTAEVTLATAPAGPFAPAPGELPRAIDALAAVNINVVFTPPAEGDFEDEFTLLVTPTGGGPVQEVTVMLTARAEDPAVAVLTPNVAFGDVRIGETELVTVTVSNPSLATPATVTRVEGLPGRFTVVGLPLALAAGAQDTFDMEYDPDALASFAFALEIFHTASAMPLVVNVTTETTTWVPEIIVDFGSVTVTGGETAWLEVDVPPHAISLSLEVQHSSATIGLLGFEGPGGRIYENAAATGAFLWNPGDEVFSATLPSSDRDELTLVDGGGVYRFRFYVFSGAASAFDVRAIVKNRPGGVVAAGVLHLNVFLAPGLGITAAAAPSTTRLQNILAEVDRIVSQSGLSLGDIDYFALTNTAFNDVSNAEFADLLAESSAAGEVRVNLFFVENTFGGNAVGVAGAVPGPALNGTPVSGVMVDYDFGNATTSGAVTAHELGHYLGLLHTVESDGAHDLIDDTLECPPSGTNGTCTTPGADYLMHWQVLNGDPVITDGQSRVLLGHPLVAPPSGLTAIALLAGAAREEIEALPEGWCGTPGCCK